MGQADTHHVLASKHETEARVPRALARSAPDGIDLAATFNRPEIPGHGTANSLRPGETAGGETDLQGRVDGNRAATPEDVISSVCVDRNADCPPWRNDR